MHGTYKGGVAKPGAKDHRKNGGHARHMPYVSTALYAANARMDRDQRRHRLRGVASAGQLSRP